MNKKTNKPFSIKNLFVLQVLGPFYEFVEDRLIPERRQSPEGGRDPSSGVHSTVSMEIPEGSDPEVEPSIGDMLGQFDIPEGFNFNRVQPDSEFINGVEG